MKIIYQAFDGKKFDTEKECVEHEMVCNVVESVALELTDSEYDPRCSDCSPESRMPNSDDFKPIAYLIVTKWQELKKIIDGETKNDH